MSLANRVEPAQAVEAALLPFVFGAAVQVDGPAGLRGIVTGYYIRKNWIEIEVSWLANNEAKSAWFVDWRVTLGPDGDS